MHFGVRELAAALSAGALIFCSSCEKHHLGEDPEVQKEHVVGGSEENSNETKSSSESPTATASPTPVNFFPENSPSP
jgi:hypothetical protein